MPRLKTLGETEGGATLVLSERVRAVGVERQEQARPLSRPARQIRESSAR